MAVNQQYTLSKIVGDICVQVGIPVPADVVASTDPNIKQLIALVNIAGQELLGLNIWPVLVRQVQLVPTAYSGASIVALPVDFFKLANNTVLNSVTGSDIYGASSPQLWTKIYTGEAVVDVQYRIIGDSMYIYPQVLDNITLEYQTNYWVKDGVNPDTGKTELVSNSDICKFDGPLIEALTRVKYLEAKEFDSTAAQRDFQKVLDQRFSVNEGAPILNIGGPVVLDWGATLGGNNLPPVIDPGNPTPAVEYPYDISFTYDAWVGDGVTLLRYPTPTGRSLRIPVNFTGSRIICDTLPTAQVTLSIVKNQSQTIGTITFLAGTSVGIWQAASETFLSGATNDVLEIIAPTPADVTFAGIGGTIVCSRTD